MEVLKMENKKYPSSVLIKFLVCSLVGIFLFFVPVSFNGKSTIPLDHIVNLVLKVQSGAIHSEIPWSENLPDCLRFFAEKW